MLLITKGNLPFAHSHGTLKVYSESFVELYAQSSSTLQVSTIIAAAAATAPAAELRMNLTS